MPSDAAPFTISFTWGDLEPCTTGHPNIVDNPRFALSGVPEGTAFIRFTLKDHDAPHYDHGGGVVAYSGQDVIEPGAFRYKSPCPPRGVHHYEWTATAQRQADGGVLATARAARQYPE